MVVNFVMSELKSRKSVSIKALPGSHSTSTGSMVRVYILGAKIQKSDPSDSICQWYVF